MASLAFDTYQLAKGLRTAGFSESQAEVLTSAVRAARDSDTAELVTKADLAITEAVLREEMADQRSELSKWIIGLLGLQTIVVVGSIAGLLRSFVH